VLTTPVFAGLYRQNRVNPILTALLPARCGLPWFAFTFNRNFSKQALHMATKSLVLQGLQSQLLNDKQETFRGNIGTTAGPVIRPGDKPTSIDLGSQKPSDLNIVMSNVEGDEWYDEDGVWFMIGGALTDQVRQFPYEIRGVWEETSFGITNDQLIQYFYLGMGWKFFRVDRNVGTDDNVDQYDEPIWVYQGTYNNVTTKNITNDLNQKSSMDYKPYINNVPIIDGSLDFIFTQTIFQKVKAGCVLRQTFRVQQGLNWPFLASVAK
jgi:hypothetical protein